MHTYRSVLVLNNKQFSGFFTNHNACTHEENGSSAFIPFPVHFCGVTHTDNEEEKVSLTEKQQSFYIQHSLMNG